MGLRCPKLIGRERETAILDALVERVTGGIGEALVLAGIAGVGKTALLTRLQRRVEDQRGTVVVGRSVPASPVAYRSLTEVVLGALSHGADLDAEGLTLHRAAFETLMTGKSSRPIGDATAPNPLLVADGLARIAASLHKPVVVVLEDVHWADPDSVLAFESLCDHAPPRGIALVATIRTDEPSEAAVVVERLRARRALDVLAVPPLSRPELEEMIGCCLGELPDPRVVELVAERSEGRPLVVEELLAAWEGVRGDVDLASMVPETLRESVGRRLDGLAPAARRLVVLAAAIGIEVDHTVLRDLHGASSEVHREALGAAEVVGLVEVTGGVVRFRHGLTRDAIVAVTPASQLEEVATRALGLLGDAAGADDSRLEAGAALTAHVAPRPALAALRLEAGRRALARGALESAVRWLMTARDDRTGDNATRTEAATLLVEALSHAGRVAAAEEAAGAALRAALVLADPAASRRVELALVRTDLVAERWRSAVQRLDAVTVPSADDALILRARAELGSGRSDVAAELARSIVERSGQAAEAAIACDAFEVLGRVARSGDLDEAAGWFEQAVRTAERGGLDAWRARALHELATIRQLDRGEVDLHGVALDAATRAGAHGVASAVLFHMAALHGVRFESELALRDGRRALELANRLGTPRQAAFAWAVIGQGHAVAGHEAQARAAAAEAVALAPHDPEIAGLAGGACIALATVLQERRSEAIVELDAAVGALAALPVRAPVSTWYLWPLLSALEGDGREALNLTDAPELRVARGFDALWLLGAAVDAGRRHEPSSARELLAASMAQFARCPGFVGYRHLGLRLASEAALEDGWADPVEWLVDAAAWFDDRGLRPSAGACRSLARRAGRPQRRQRGEPVAPALARLGITSREVDVLRLIADGLTNRQVAERLYISPRTVKTHVEHLLAKTGAGNRAGLASLAAVHLDGAEERPPAEPRP